MNLRSLVTRHHKGYNDRDLDALSKVFDEDVEMMVDGAAFRGVAAALGYATATFREFPRLQIHDTRVVSESGDTIVSRHQILNGDPSGGPLRPQGSVCEIYRVRDGRIYSYTCFYAPESADREDVVNVPSRAEGSKVAEEQAALRRVATLVARGVAQDELFAAVNEEVGWLVGADPTSLMRFEADDTVTLVGAWSAADAGLPIGARRPVDDELRSLRDDGRALRLGPLELPPDGPFVEEARQLAIRSAVGVPIVVDGRVWGAAFAASTREEPFPEDTTARIAGFTGLVATAIANTEAGMQVERLADEQAALRRVATLVARGAAPEEVFAAVTEEVARLFLADLATMCRYESDGTYTIVASAGTPFPVGSRWPLGGKNLATLVFETERPARIENYAEASGPLADNVRAVGGRSAVGAPIIVEDRLWGATGVVTSREQPLPTDTEARLASFMELVATAISNTEARTEAGRLADDQAALRRVATLVARGAPADDLFAAVVEEVGQRLPVDFADLGRYEPDGTLTFLAAWGKTGAVFSVGARWRLGGSNVSTVVAHTGGPARIERYADASGPIGVAVRDAGVRSAVGTPIIVDGRLWGAMAAGSTLEEPLPEDTETRLAQFTELLATAIANAESRAGLARLAEEQAALRRVATLVARGVPPGEVFAAVTEEVERLLPVDFAHLGRYGPDGTITVLAASGTTAEDFPVGRRWSLGGKNLATIVFETGRPGRIDGYADAFGPLGDTGRQLGIHSSAGTPIIVEGHVWGVIVAGSSLKPGLPPDTEARLASFTELVATAISNTEARTALAASRGRIVAATDEERRRVVRDLHDGAQQRLVHTVITLKLAQQAMPDEEDDLSALLAEALDHAEQATGELRELAHGILPRVLTQGGLRAGVDALASRTPVPVEIDVSVGRLPAAVEATAYFVVAEALTNVAKHSRAGHAEVTARIEHATLAVQVRDDGVGGARPQGGGLVGLADRVAALDGRLRVESPAAAGTLVAAVIPLPGY